MTKLRERANHVFRHYIVYYAAADWLTLRGKRMVLGIAALVLSSLQLVLWAGGVETDWSIAIWVLLFGFYLAIWAVWDPDARACPGPRNNYVSPSGEMSIGICHGCENWIIMARGEVVATGYKAKPLAEKLRELATSWSRNVPHVGAEMIQAAEKVEADGDLRTDHAPSLEGMPPIPTLGEAMQTAADNAKGQSGDQMMASVIEELNKTMTGSPGVVGAAVMIPASEYAQFVKWRENNKQPEEAAPHDG